MVLPPQCRRRREPQRHPGVGLIAGHQFQVEADVATQHLQHPRGNFSIPNVWPQNTVTRRILTGVRNNVSIRPRGHLRLLR